MKKRFLLLSVILTRILTFAQTSPNLLNVVQPAPNTASLEKYADIPVSPYTGVPDISLPLYTIKSKDITVPITLSYHASGIKVSEEASQTGLGWVLNAGGEISRNITGYDDFKDYGYCTGNMPFKDYSNGQGPTSLVQAGCLLQCLNLSDPNSSTLYTDDLSSYLSISRYDFEPDQFYYNFLGKNGKFILKRDREAVLQNQQALEINVSGPDGQTWQVRDENGFVYNFEELETYTDLSGSEGGSQQTHTTGWFLTKITSPAGNIVTFTYTHLAFDNLHTIGAYSETNQSVYVCSNPNMSSGSTGYQSGAASGNQFSLVVLDQINFDNGYVKFNYSDNRLDLPGDQRLDKIDVYTLNYNNGSFNLLKSVELAYDYFTSVSGYDYQVQGGNPYKRLKLLNVKEKGYYNNQSVAQNSYTFNYYQTGNFLLPAKTSFSRDHWGYYNGKSNTSFIPSTISVSSSDLATYYLGLPGPERDPDPRYTQACSLQSIQYATGGSTEFQYESNDFDEQLSQVNDHSFFRSKPTLIEQSETQMFDVVNNRFVTTTILDLSSGYVDPESASPGTKAHMQVKYRFGVNNICTTNINPGNIRFTINDDNGNPTTYQDKDLADYMTCASSPTYPCKTCATNTIIYELDLELVPGKYTIVVSVNASYATNVNLQDITFYTSYQTWSNSDETDYTNTHAFAYGGGIRIKRIINHDNISSANDIIKHYIYHYQQDKNQDGTDEEYSFGRRMSKPQYSYWVKTNDQYVSGGDANQTFYYTTMHLTRSSESNNQLNGSAAGNVVGYDEVTELFGENGENGKIVYKYHNQPDIVNAYNDPDVGYPLKPPYGSNVPDPLNGSLLQKTIYQTSENTFYKASDLINTYGSTIEKSGSTENKVYGIQPVTINSYHNGSLTAGAGCSVYLMSHYALRSEWIYLQNSVQRTYNSQDETKYTETTTSYTYDNTKHFLPTRIEQTTSDGEVAVTQNTYPLDYSITGTPNNDIARGVQKLQASHVVSPVIEQYIRRYNSDGVTNLRTVAGSFTVYKPTSPNLYVINKLEINKPLTNFQPAAISASSATTDARYKPQVFFNGYDTYGNILEQQSVNNIKHSYLWEYNNQYPVAEVTNAAQSSIAYTSFESDGWGNWVKNNGSIYPSSGKTGNKSFTLGGTNSLKWTTTTSGNYIVSYWVKSGGAAVKVNNAAGTSITTKNGWTLFQHKLSGVTSVNITGTATIDELRLYPATAQMTTYTYDPLIGMTSQCDASDHITYYQYDGLGRLQLIRDQDGNILKQFDYKYQSAP